VRTTVTVDMVSRYGVSSYTVEVINYVFQLKYQVFGGISKCNIRNNDGVYHILSRNMLK
jgi:hypothetical protein